MNRPSMTSRLRSDAGFTMSELVLVAVVVVGLLLIITVSVGNIRSDTSQSNCQSDLRTLKLATEQYFATNDRYPASKNELVTAGLVTTDQVSRWRLQAGAATTTRPEFVPTDTAC